MRGTTGSVNDVVETNSSLHGEEVDAFGDADSQGAHKLVDAKPGGTWYILMRPGKLKFLDLSQQIDASTERIEKLKASIRAKEEDPFRVTKQ
jgi:IS5 family transposase